MRPAEHVAAQGRRVRPRRGSGHLPLQLDLVHVLQVVQAVHVDAPAAVVVLRRQLALAVLELQPLEVVHDRGDVLLFRGQEVLLPAAVLRGLVAACVEAAVQLREDVRRVEGFQAGRLHPAAAALRHLVQHRDVVREAVLPGRHGLEQGREAALALHVHQGLMLGLPVERREGLALQDQAQGQAAAGVLAAADARPHGEAVDELEQLEVVAVADDRAEDLAHEAALDAVALAGRLLVAVLVQHRAVPVALQPADVRGPLHRLAHLPAPVERGPQRALEPGRLDELQRQVALLVAGARPLAEEPLVLLDELAVGAVGLLAHEVVVGPLELLALAARPDLARRLSESGLALPWRSWIPRAARASAGASWPT